MSAATLVPTYPPAAQFKNVLFAADFSACSKSALRYAQAIAQRFSATIHVVHVVGPEPLIEALGVPYPTWKTRMQRQGRRPNNWFDLRPSKASHTRWPYSEVRCGTSVPGFSGICGQTPDKSLRHLEMDATSLDLMNHDLRPFDS